MNTILLGNLIKIRWIAIFGQLFAVFFVSYIIKIQIPLYETLTIILFSVAVNIYSYYEERKNKSINNIKTFSFLLFDTVQLGILLFLTRHNKSFFYTNFSTSNYFCFILTCFNDSDLSMISILMIIILNFYFIPLNLGQEFYLPEIYSFGLVHL